MVHPERPLILIAALAALAAAPAAAQYDRDADFASALSAARAAASQARTAAGLPQQMTAPRQAAPTPQNLLESTLTAMNDGPTTAGLLAQWLRDNRAVIGFSDMAKGRSSHAWAQGGPGTPAVPMISLDPSLASAPASSRRLAVYLAKETAELMLKDFPESAERSYMVASRAAETFFELGGTRATMGDIDGHQDAQAEALIRLWVEHDSDSGVAYLKSQGAPPLAESDAAQKQFEAFKGQEKEWLMTNQGMLQ
jgi:hypothetical protein